MDHVEDTHDEQAADKTKRGAVAGGAAGGAAVGGGAAAAGSRSRDVEKGEESEEEEEEEEEEEKRGRFAFVGDFLGAVSTAAKEMVATELLGDDFGPSHVHRALV